ncbi:NAD(P)H-hydrate dehydratase, partial [Candidatus Omnitrophota bacterium]
MQWHKILIKRTLQSHKADFGHVLAVGASTGLSGALSLTALACLRSGAGSVTVGVPRDLNAVFEVKLTEVMSLPLESRMGVLSERAFIRIKGFIAARKVNVLAL